MRPPQEAMRPTVGVQCLCRGWLWLAFGLAMLLGSPVHAKRVALVVGNSAYSDRPLRNPVNDAELMQRTLQGLGFEVSLVRNADRRALLSGLRDFEANALNAEVALFFYAGHGAQVAGNNYLIPLNAQIRAESDVQDEAVDANSVLRRLEDARARIGLVILDACRDNPFTGASRSSARGLGRMNVPTGSIVAYATEPGSTADDGTGRNGVYTEQLSRHLSQPGLDLREVFDRTALEVERLTGGKQRPREDIGLRGRVVLKPGEGTQVAIVTPEPTGRPVQPPRADPEQEAWELAKRRDTVAAYEGFLASFPNGRLAASARSALVGLRPAQTSQPAQAVQQPHANQLTSNTTQAARPDQVFRDCDAPYCPEMVVIPAGSFAMGSSVVEQEIARKTDLDNIASILTREGPRRQIAIRSFAASRYEIARGQFAAFVNATSYKTEAERYSGCYVRIADKFEYQLGIDWRNPGFTQDDSHPVVCISWNDAQAYIKWLRKSTGLDYRLLSEAEFEYATKANTQTIFWWGDHITSDLANYVGSRTFNGSPKGEFRGSTSTVNSFASNPFGLYNVHGNVQEWIQDCAADDYTKGQPIDGTSHRGDDINCSTRVLRGGSWHDHPGNLRSSGGRVFAPVNARANMIGFRVARSTP